MEEFVFNDYRNYIKENKNYLSKLKNSILLDRLEDLISVLEHLNNIKQSKIKLSKDEINIFRTGFYYFTDQVDLLLSYCKDYFNNSVNRMLKKDTEINYLLYINDFKHDLYSITSDMNYFNYFDDIEKSIENNLDKEVELDNIMDLVNEKSNKAYTELNSTYNSVLMIFSEISDVYNLGKYKLTQ